MTTEPVGIVEVDPRDLVLLVGEGIELTATVRGSDGERLRQRDLQWSSSDPRIVTVEEGADETTAWVVAVGEGEATVTARAEGVSARAAVTVYRPFEVEILQESQSVTGFYTTEGDKEVLECYIPPGLFRATGLYGLPGEFARWRGTTIAAYTSAEAVEPFDEDGLSTSWTVSFWGGRDSIGRLETIRSADWFFWAWGSADVMDGWYMRFTFHYDVCANSACASPVEDQVAAGFACAAPPGGAADVGGRRSAGVGRGDARGLSEKADETRP